MDNVTWEYIRGYNKKYRVSSKYGIVQRYCKTLKVWIELKQGFHKDGYPVVSLYSRCGKHKRVTVHRLVASAFIPNPENKETVNHINRVKTDNCATNLEWMTFSENYQDMVKGKVRKQVKGQSWCRSKHTDKQIKEVKKLIKKGFTTKEISEKLNIKRHIINDVRTGKTWSHII